jgi:hypothetical protein
MTIAPRAARLDLKKATLIPGLSIRCRTHFGEAPCAEQAAEAPPTSPPHALSIRYSICPPDTAARALVRRDAGLVAAGHERLRA